MAPLMSIHQQGWGSLSGIMVHESRLEEMRVWGPLELIHPGLHLSTSQDRDTFSHKPLPRH